MKYVNKLSVRIVIAVVISFLLAGAATKITYTCPPIDGAAGCVSHDKAVMRPSDLLNNKQDSLVHFSETFMIASLISFALLGVLSLAEKNKT